MFGVANGINELRKGNFVTGLFDIVASLIPFFFKGVRSAISKEGLLKGFIPKSRNISDIGRALLRQPLKPNLRIKPLTEEEFRSLSLGKQQEIVEYTRNTNTGVKYEVIPLGGKKGGPSRPINPEEIISWRHSHPSDQQPSLFDLAQHRRLQNYGGVPKTQGTEIIVTEGIHQGIHSYTIKELYNIWKIKESGRKHPFFDWNRPPSWLE